MNGEDDPKGYKPTERADVDRRKSVIPQQRPRKYPDGKKLRLKNDQSIPEYEVTIVSAVYDQNRHKWMYTLKDWEMKPIPGENPEDSLD